MIDTEALAKALVDAGLAEEHRGYGHATGEDVAEFVDQWLINGGS